MTQVPLRGLMVVGHGTRDARGRAELEQMVAGVADQLVGVAVEPCYLELARPTIAEALTRLAERGARQVGVVPLLLLEAGHAKRDIPRALAEAVKQTFLAGRRMDIRQALHLGCHRSLVELSALRYREVLERSSACGFATERTIWLMVGRGSHDPDAIAEMQAFVGLRRELTRMPRVEICYMAMAQPSLEGALARIARIPAECVVVQPHLLFWGQLAEALERRIADVSRDQPDRQWLLARHLGPHALLVDAICQRANAIDWSGAHRSCQL